MKLQAIEIIELLFGGNKPKPGIPDRHPAGFAGAFSPRG
jgi:methylmalonyl-CoA mutase cobalamin-binding subunit